MKRKGPTPLSEIGEFGLIERLTTKFTLKNPSSVTGVGDDAAVINTGEEYLVVTTDLLTEGIHFNLIYTPLKHLGYKAVAVNLSDIYAMNAKPEQITVSIAVSGKFSVESLEELYSGIFLGCEKFKVDLVGGDTTSSLTGLTISITAIGRVRKEDIVYRKGAQINDLICVSGDLGAAYLGLQLLEREKTLFEKGTSFNPDFSGKDYLLERQLKPEPRADIISLLKKNGISPTSMIDISDGLSSDLLHICKNSGTGCRIYQDKIPIDAMTALTAGEFLLEPVICALHGGEDYELLFTVPLADYNKVSVLKDLHVIGNITGKDESVYMVTNEGNLVQLMAQGWDHLTTDNMP
jgi:thiamine-monophosphate kinase